MCGMDFKTFWLSIPVQQRGDFAGRCGAKATYLNMVAFGAMAHNGKPKRVSAAIAIAIERESGGAVRCETLRPDVDWAYLRGRQLPGGSANDSMASAMRRSSPCSSG